MKYGTISLTEKSWVSVYYLILAFNNKHVIKYCEIIFFPPTLFLLLLYGQLWTYLNPIFSEYTITEHCFSDQQHSGGFFTNS